MLEFGEDFDFAERSLTVGLMLERRNLLYCYACLGLVIVSRSEQEKWRQNPFNRAEFAVDTYTTMP